MKTLLLLLFAGLTAHAQLQTISDTLTNAAGGGQFTGRITVTLNAPGSAQPLYYLTTSLTGWSMVYCVGITSSDCSVTSAAGTLVAALYANSTITPAGTSYSARYQPARGGAYTETWVVAVGNTKLYQVRSTAVPSPTTTFGEGQLAVSSGAIIYGSAAGVGAELPLGTLNYCLTAGATAPLWAVCSGGGGGSGTVTSVSVTTANGVSGSVATATTTPAITLTLGAITPTSVAASGAVSGSNLSGTNTGDQTTVSGNAGTATALAANPADCSANNFATTIAANGDLTCAQPSISAGVSGLGTGVATALGTPSSANFRSAITDETGTGVAVFNDTPTLLTPAITGAISFPDGTRQTFNPDGTNAGVNVGSQAGDPSTPSNGDLWYDSTANELTARINGANVALGAGGGAAATYTKSWNISNPSTAESGDPQFTIPFAATVTRVWCNITDSTSVTINLDERAEATPNTAGTAVLTSSLVCDTNGEVTTTFSNASIAQRVPVALTVSAVSGTPRALRVHVEYTIP